MTGTRLYGFDAVLAQSPDGLLFGPAFEIVTAQGTAIGATIAALAASAGDSLAVRNAPLDKMIRLLNAWTDVQVAGTARLRSPKLHDNVQGIRWDTIIGDPRPVLPFSIPQRYYPNDVIAAELAGSAVAGDIEYLVQLIQYDDLVGANGRFITWEELVKRAINIFPVENTIATGTGGGYTGSEAINVEFDQFHAGGLYALAGYTVDAEAAAIGWRGADIANLRIGGPSNPTEKELTADWFIRLSRFYSLPLIPVFSAENKGGILIDAVQDENGADVTVNSMFIELSPGPIR